MSNENNYIRIDDSESENFEESESESETEDNQEDLNEQNTEENENKTASKRKWDEANACPICLSPWSSTGSHQIASLKCGHLFGYRCIIKWLKRNNTKDSRCPCCNSHAIVKNVRKLYACNIKVEDNSQFESIKKEKIEMESYCEWLKKEKLNYQIYFRIANEQLITNKNTINDYKQQLKKLKTKKTTSDKYQLNSTYVIDNNLDSARVLSYDAIGKYLYVTKSLNIKNYGIVRLDLAEEKINNYYQLHEKTIKDIQCNPINESILSCSMDKTLQIFSNKTKDIDICVPLECPPWSCCWSTYNENQIFVGLSNKSVLMYDIRNLSTYCTKLYGCNSLKSPVHSLIYVNNLNKNNSSKLSSGILGANLEDIFYYDQETIDQNNNESKKEINPKLKYQQPGSCVSLSFDSYTQQILSTWRYTSSSGLGLLNNYNIDYLQYSPINNSTTPKKQKSNQENNFISSFEYMKELENKPHYPISFERRQEIYGYSGQTQLTRNIIFSECSNSNKLNENNKLISAIDNSENKDSVNSVQQDDLNNEEIDEKKKIINNDYETFVCASDEGSCSSIIWKCYWNNDYELAQHSLYQQLPSENHLPILDIKHCPIINTHTNLLACLTKNQIFFYKK